IIPHTIGMFHRFLLAGKHYYCQKNYYNRTHIIIFAQKYIKMKLIYTLILVCVFAACKNEVKKNGEDSDRSKDASTKSTLSEVERLSVTLPILDPQTNDTLIYPEDRKSTR